MVGAIVWLIVGCSNGLWSFPSLDSANIAAVGVAGAQEHVAPARGRARARLDQCCRTRLVSLNRAFIT
jgi:hypothetical protein